MSRPADDISDITASLNNISEAIIRQLHSTPVLSHSLKCEFEKLYSLLSSSAGILSPSEKIPLLINCRCSIEAEQLMFTSLSPYIARLKNGWNFFEQLFESKDKETVLRALRFLDITVHDECLKTDSKIFSYFAGKIYSEDPVFTRSEALKLIGSIFNVINTSGRQKLLQIFIYEKNIKLRFFAARLLDAAGINPDETTLAEIPWLNSSDLLPYFYFTRITYSELLYLVPDDKKPRQVIETLSECMEVCNEDILKSVISELGWKNVNSGLSVRELTGLRIEGSLPYFLYKNEAGIFSGIKGAVTVPGYLLFTASGELPFEKKESDDHTDVISLFRSYNLSHADLLKEILDIAPLDRNKIKSIITQLDRITADFIALFHSYTEECSVLPGVYNDIRNKVMSRISGDHEEQISADTTRLVQMFEDPRNIGEVHTLHGLKRYLHQKGLQLGFKLVGQSKTPNRTASILLVRDNKIVSSVKRISYADFEPAGDDGEVFPYPVKIVLDGFARQMLYGQKNFPSINIFCYGNEVHYFIWFRNHPVFIRIDFSPPLEGGMIDLQYFCVSNYELSEHPNITLDYIRYFFEILEFNVNMSGTHIHARYDKERALNLDELCEKAEYLFCLVPYLMDLDWIIGSFNLDQGARKKIARAWAESFLMWGVLPFSEILTTDKAGILQKIIRTPEGDFQIRWDGTGVYGDIFSDKISPDFIYYVYNKLEMLSLKIPEMLEAQFLRPGQIHLEKKLLNYFRKALVEGSIIDSDDGFRICPPDLFTWFHETEYFCELISRSGDDLKKSSLLGKIIMPLERTLKFQDTGRIEGFRTQAGDLPLRGGSYKLFVLRDTGNIIRLAFFTTGSFPFRFRKNKNSEWSDNIKLSSAELEFVLRKNNYNVPGLNPAAEIPVSDLISTDDIIKSRNALNPVNVISEKIIYGLSASRGKVSGRVLLGTGGREPEDFDDHILIAPALSPDENTFIYHSAGIAATGGGILSHAGLTASQFNKPALIIPGNWVRQSDGSAALEFKTIEYTDENIKRRGFNTTVYKNFREKGLILKDGDLVLLDSENCLMKIYGQGQEIIFLYEGFKSLGKAEKILSEMKDLDEILPFRGKVLHIMHQLTKIIGKLKDPVLASYAIREILTGNLLGNSKNVLINKSLLIQQILNNSDLMVTAQKVINEIVAEISGRFNVSLSGFKKNIEKAQFPFEAVMPRLDLLHLADELNILKSFKEFTGVTLDYNSAAAEVNSLCRMRLKSMLEKIETRIKILKQNEDKREILRHLLRQQGRLNLLLQKSRDVDEELLKIRNDFETSDRINAEKLSGKIIIRPSDGAIETSPFAGWKAANLAELDRLCGGELVPPWFVIADRAFQQVLNIFLKINIKNQETASGTLFEGIDKIISRKDLTNNEKSVHIRNLWSSITLPPEITGNIVAAYNEIKRDSGADFFVAVRSSSCEEDAEINARAGEFETHLYINGENQLLDFIKRTWSGLWTERAIHNRSVYGIDKIRASGGVIVQKMINSRISGVLQTINLAKGDLYEIVINAGLGLGEGVVSGLVSADQVTISKTGDPENTPLRFNYITADKNSQVVFDRKSGTGTVLTKTLYHQRFRPALEYIEIKELVIIASMLEQAYGYPLDIEFAFEESKLWILQVRPVAAFLPAFMETLNHYPICVMNNSVQEKII